MVGFLVYMVIEIFLLIHSLFLSVVSAVLGFGSICSGKLIFVHDKGRRGEGSVEPTHLALSVVEMDSQSDVDKHFSFPNC